MSRLQYAIQEAGRAGCSAPPEIKPPIVVFAHGKQRAFYIPKGKASIALMVAGIFCF